MSVVPAKAGTHFATVKSQWIPASAGMTNALVIAVLATAAIPKATRGLEGS